MNGLTHVKQLTFAGCLTAFVSLIYLWCRAELALQSKPKAILQSDFPQHWPAQSQSQYEHLNEYLQHLFSGEVTVVQ